MGGTFKESPEAELVHFENATQSAFTCSNLTIETLGQGMKYVQS